MGEIGDVKEEHQIVIAGAGPAGLAASLQLAQYHIPHLLVEKGSFPKDKICGDALSGKVLDNLAKINPGLKTKLLARQDAALPSYGVMFIAPNGNILEVPFKSDLSKVVSPPGFISKRLHFDQFLFEQLDQQFCDYRPGTALKSVRKENGSIILDCQNGTGQETIRCKLVLGAEGDRSVVARKLAGHSVEDEHYCGGLRCYYKGVEGMHAQGFIELHFIGDILPGYFWIFPLPNGEVNAGIGMLRKAIRRKRVNLREKFREIIESHPVISKRFRDAIPLEEPKGWGLPLGSKVRDLAGDGYLLTGDAASLIDPFTGEGIGNALLSGRLAAAMARSALEQDRFDSAFLGRYTHEVYGKVRSELKLSTTLQRLSAHDWLFNFVVGKASRNKALQETITCMFEDVGLRSKLADPRFYFRLLFNK